MVTGGDPDPKARLVEIIDIIDPTRTCAPLTDFPERMPFTGLGIAVMNGSLIACGRYQCYKYENDAWSPLKQLNVKTDKSCATVLKGKNNKYIERIKKY